MLTPISQMRPLGISSTVERESSRVPEDSGSWATSACLVTTICKMRTRSLYAVFVVLVIASISTSGLKFARVNSFIRVIKSSFQGLTSSVKGLKTSIIGIRTSIETANWIKVFSNIDHTLDKFKKLRKRIRFDISAGYGSISSPEETESNLELLTPEVLDEILLPKSPVLWAHQVGKRVVRKVPDTALLGVLVLISSELLRRAVNSNSETLPPVIREFAKATILELDTKLEILSSLEWKVDPFLRAELENLQTQPLEVIDKFIVTSILPSVDKDFAPFLLKYMVGDTKKVKTITQSLKDLIQLSMVLLEGTGSLQGSLRSQNPTVLDRTTTTIIEQVDLVGQSIEEVVNDWNRIVVQFTGSWTELLNTDSVLTLLNKQFLIRESSNLNIVDGTMSYIGNATVNQNGINSEIGNGNGNKNGIQRTQKLLFSNKRVGDSNLSAENLEHKNHIRDGSISRSTSNDLNSENLNDENINNGNGINRNKISPSSDSHDRNGNRKKIISIDGKEETKDEKSWSYLLKISKNKNIEKPLSSRTTFLNDITKKSSNVDISSKKNSSLKQSAFTSYLQELMDFN